MQQDIKKFFQGDVLDDQQTRELYSRDASLFKIEPKLVVFPKHAEDIKSLVRWVSEHKTSITPRSAGTCMSGGSIGEGIVMDVTKYMNKIISFTTPSSPPQREGEITTQPGVFYRDFEKETLQHNLVLPCFTASKDLNAIGGMIGNNSGGEKSIKYGKMEKYVLEQKAVFSDGKEYTVTALTRTELDAKMAQNDFEGSLYKQLFELIENNYKLIQSAKPDVSKNSAGYYLWNVWDRETQIFDLNKLLVGSQGTLAITTEATLKLVPVEPAEKMLVVFMTDLHNLGEVVTEILKYNPDSVESYDDASAKLALKFFPDFIKQLGLWGALKLGIRFIPELWMTIKGGIPKLVMIVEFTGESDELLLPKVKELQHNIEQKFNLKTRVPKTDAGEQKYWKVRHESFNLLRKHVKGRRTAPFIDDIIVRPEFLPEFLPRLTQLLNEYKLTYTVAGHAGNGNFHIIPLMNMKQVRNQEIILELSEKVYDLVLRYEGSITAEHNDGIIRTPYLEKMYGSEVTQLFAQVKKIFDPLNIFNPGKKVGGTVADITKWLEK